MSIPGYINSVHSDPPAPYVQGTVYFPRLDRGGIVRFLVDTGADITYLHEGNVRGLGINIGALEGNRLYGFGGITGTSEYYREPALALFRDNVRGDLMCQLVIGLQANREERPSKEAPPLLGRDFLNLCDLRVNPARGLVQLEPFNVEGGFIR